MYYAVSFLGIHLDLNLTHFEIKAHTVSHISLYRHISNEDIFFQHVSVAGVWRSSGLAFFIIAWHAAMSPVWLAVYWNISAVTVV